MARGWESKSVESQMEDAAARRAGGRADPRKQTGAPGQVKRNCLELDLLRVRGELSRCSNPRLRALLEAELRHLEALVRQDPA